MNEITASSSSKSNELVSTVGGTLTSAQFQDLADVPEVVEWLANIESETTREAYRKDIEQFVVMMGIEHPEEFRTVKRAHVIAWRNSLKESGRGASTIRRKLSALSSLYDYLCEKNSVSLNPVSGVKRPTEGANEGHTPALSQEQAKALLDAPPTDTTKGLRDRALIATYLFHGSRESETANLKLSDIQEREGVPHFRFFGKGSKVRYVPVNPIAMKRIQDYLRHVGREVDYDSPIFQPIKNHVTNVLRKPLSRMAVYNVIKQWGLEAGIPAPNLRPHALRATFATTALKNGAPLENVQECLGHSDISTTRIYDRRKFSVEDSPVFNVNY